MSTLSRPLLKPRKLPVQARSQASVEAIHEAAIQVLLREGKEELTTTKVAARAGVSVGTLYQYFPNKSSLLQAVLRKHLEQVLEAVTVACSRYGSEPLPVMGQGLVGAFLKAKFERIDMSLALYQISSDVEGAAIVRSVSQQATTRVEEMLRSAREQLTTDPGAAAAMLYGVLAGASRRMLEADEPYRERVTLERELRLMVGAYLEALTAT